MSFVNDTGLFVTLAFRDKDITENVIYQKLLSDKLSADLGYVYENIVAQMLKVAGNELFYHTWPTESGKHNYEIDFLLSRGSKVCPIEVKSSGYKNHASLDAFLRKYPERVGQGYLLYTKDLNNVFQHGTTARGNHEAYLVRERRDDVGIASHVFCTVELYPVGRSLVQNIVKIYAAVLVGRSLATFGIVYFPIAIYQYRRGQ